MLRIVTKSETYTVDANGNIGRPAINMAPSGQWKLRGLVRYNNFGHRVAFVPFDAIKNQINEFQWTYKNGKPIWQVADLDHGTDREWAGPAQGVIRIILDIKPTYYECGICGAYHDATWNGDCREDAARVDPDELDARLGINGWRSIDMDDVDNFQAGKMRFCD